MWHTRDLLRIEKQCLTCDANNPALAHPPKYLTDFNSDAQNEETFWQSETMAEGVSFPNTVNLTLNLGMGMEITYIRIKFHSPRPESFAIFKKTHLNSTWQPYQYYSASCLETFGIEPDRPVREDDQVLCNSKFSDIVPLTGGNVPFPTLENRPGRDHFSSKPKLQEWVTASALRIQLTRVNTYRDDIFGDLQVLRSYYYAISDISIGGKCKCHGHANLCKKDQYGDWYCICQHHTTGRGCEKCEEFYQDSPWARASSQSVGECKPCECNGHSDKCEFSELLYKTTNSGGNCTQCMGNTRGQHCESCIPEHYRSAALSLRDPCLPCSCNTTGSRSLECAAGICKCKDNVIGNKCDRCSLDSYQFSADGCVKCECSRSGSETGGHVCSSKTGQCRCKMNTESRQCDACKPGHFFLDASNSIGCLPCRCSGRSKTCRSADSHRADDIVYTPVVDSSVSVEGWSGIDESNGRPLKFGVVTVRSTDGQSRPALSVEATSLDVDLSNTYIKLPAKFLGDQSLSFSRSLSWDLGVRGSIGRIMAPSGWRDVVLEATNGLRVTTSLSVHNPDVFNSLIRATESMSSQDDSVVRWVSLTVPLLDDPRRKLWRAENFPSGMVLTNSKLSDMLTNLSSIYIRPFFLARPLAYIGEVRLVSASTSARSGEIAGWVEQCECPAGYTGQFCQTCAPGFYKRRYTPTELNLSPALDDATRLSGWSCIPCHCFNHAKDVKVQCDAETGQCDCAHNTAGPQCNICADGFYGDSTVGTPTDCQSCPCEITQEIRERENLSVALRHGPCFLAPSYLPTLSASGRSLRIGGDATSLSEIPHCRFCPHGTMGARCDTCLDGFFGSPKDGIDCEACNCHGNADTNAVGWCDRKSGTCLRCQYNTEGPHCERCRTGYYGDPTQMDVDRASVCHPCSCNTHGTRKQTERADAFLPAANEDTGLLPCDSMGKCDCLDNVQGNRCDKCASGHFNISSGQGCSPCGCHALGSASLNCDVDTGVCQCRDHVVGPKCDSCRPLHYGMSLAGCTACGCSPIGSTRESQLQCDDLGQCTCLENVMPPKCDICKENSYDLAAGCPSCPECYNLVQHGINDLRGNLSALLARIDHIEKNGTNVDLNDANFKTLLTQMKTKVTSVQKKFDDAKTREQVENAITEVAKLNEEISAWEKKVKDGKSLLDQSSIFLARWREALEEAQNVHTTLTNRLAMIDKSIDDVARAMDVLEEAAKNHGQSVGVLNDYAQKAREALKKLEAAKVSITSHLTDISEQNAIARQLLRDFERITLTDRHDIVRRIESILTDLDATLTQIDSNAQLLKTDIEARYTEALAVKVKVENILASEAVVTDAQLNDYAESQEAQAADFKDVNEKILMKHRKDLRANYTTEVNKCVSEGRTAVEAAKAAQRMLDQLLSVLDALQAKNPASKAEQTLTEARKLLMLLENSNSWIQGNKTASEMLIKEYDKRSQQLASMETVSGPQNDQAIEELSRQAERVASETAQKSASISDAEGLVDQLQEGMTIGDPQTEDPDELARVVSDLEAQLTTTTSKTEELQNTEVPRLNKAIEDGNSDIDSALEKADKLQPQIDDILALLEEMENKIENGEAGASNDAGSLAAQLDELERSLDMVDEVLKGENGAGGGLKHEVDALEATVTEMEQKRRDTEEVIKEVNNEIARLQHIEEALPADKCFDVSGSPI